MTNIDVLIVEDDPIISSIHKSLVESVAGFTVVALAATRDEIFECLTRKQPNLVILDCKLPEYSGIEVISFARSKRLPIDFIIVTAENAGMSINLAFRYGISDYILKPFRTERFKASLTSYRDFIVQLSKKYTLSQVDIDAWYKTKIPS